MKEKLVMGFAIATVLAAWIGFAEVSYHLLFDPDICTRCALGLSEVYSSARCK